MATVVEPLMKTPEPDSRVWIPGVDWATYEAALQPLGEHPSIRLAYDGESLEIMSPSPEHEAWAKQLDPIITDVAAGLRLPCRALGSTTWRNEAEERGLEADAYFCRANFPRVRGKKTLDLNVDPPPDLAVGVEVSRSASDRLAIYARLGVPEVWRFDGERSSVWCLQPDGAYAQAATSLNLPQLGLDEVVQWMNQAVATQDLTEWLEAFETWVRDELAPRV